MATYNATPVQPDIGSWVLFPGKQDDVVYLVGSILIDKYLTVPAPRYSLVMRIIDELRQGSNPEQIEEQLKEQGYIVNVRDFCKVLARNKIIEYEDELDVIPNDEKAKDEGRWGTLFGQIRALSWDVVRIDLSSSQPFFEKTARLFLGGILFLMIASTIAVLLSGINFFNLGTVARQIFYGKQFAWLISLSWFTMPIFVLLHEFSHSCAASMGHVYPRQLSFRLYLMFVPYFSLQLPGLYTLPIKQRFTAIMAGPCLDFTLGNVFFLLAKFAGVELAPYFLFMAFTCYARFFYNALPVLPMTDGYALFSQAFFRDIDVRGHATQEFRRWREKKTNQFRGKYVVFFIFNLFVVSFIVVAGTFQTNFFILGWVNSFGWLKDASIWWSYAGLLLVDGLMLYLARNRLKVLLGY